MDSEEKKYEFELYEEEKYEFELYVLISELNSTNNKDFKINFLSQIEEILTNTNYCNKEILLNLSYLLNNNDLDIKCKATNVLAYYAIDDYKVFKFVELFEQIELDLLNRRFECIGIVAEIICVLARRTNLFLNNQYLNEEKNIIKNILLSNIKITDDNLFTEKVYFSLYEYLNKKVCIVRPLFGLNQYLYFFMILNGLSLWKIFNERPFERIRRMSFLISNNEAVYITNNLCKINGKLPILLIKTIFNNNEINIGKLSNQAINNVLLYFLKFFSCEESSDSNLQMNENEIFKQIFEATNNLENNNLNNFECSFRIFLDFIIKNMGFMGFCYFQKSIYQRHLFQNIYRFLNDEFNDNNSFINKNDFFRDNITNKFLKLFFENLAHSGGIIYNYLEGIQVIFNKCKPESFTFFDNFIENINRAEFTSNSQLENILFILQFAKINGLFSFDKKFIDHLDYFCSSQTREEIFNKLNISADTFDNPSFKMYKILTTEFIKMMSVLLDKFNYFPLWLFFAKISKKFFSEYKPDHDEVLNWLLSKISIQHNLSANFSNLLEQLVEKLNNNNNPIIKQFLKDQKNLLVPGLKEEINEYDDFMKDEDHSLSDMNIRNLVDNDNLSTSIQGKSEKMTSKEIEENLKEKIKDIVNISQNKREYYEEIYQNLIKEVKIKNKNFNSVLTNIVKRKISKSLLNLNKDCISIMNLDRLTEKVINFFFEIIHNNNFSFAHIVLKTQICLTFNVIDLVFFGLKLGDFENKKDKLVKDLLDNCFKSLYIEANRAYNRYTLKGDLETITEEDNEKIEDSNINSDFEMLSNDSSIQDSFSMLSISGTEAQLTINKNNKVEYFPIEDFEEMLENLNSSNLYNNDIHIIEQSYNHNKNSISYSKFSHIFSFTGYTNLVSKSKNAFLKEISLLLKSEYLPPEIKEKFKDFIDIIIELEFLISYNKKGESKQSYYEKWTEKNKILFERNFLNYIINFNSHAGFVNI